MVMFYLFWILTVACWVYALRCGGLTARWGFVLFVLGVVATMFAQGLADRQGLEPIWTGVNLPLFLVDFLYLVGLYVLALKSDRYWPIWSAGFQLVSVLTHLGPLIDPETRPTLYRGLESVWVLPILLTMIIGIAKDRRHPQ